MKARFKDLFNAMKYKRKMNTYKTKYEEVVDGKIRDKEKIIDLQNNLLAAKDKIKELEEVVDYYKRKYAKKEMKKEK